MLGEIIIKIVPRGALKAREQNLSLLLLVFLFPSSERIQNGHGLSSTDIDYKKLKPL